MRTKKKAVVIGIDYVKSQSPLQGCSVDAKNVGELFHKLGFDEIDIYTEQDTPDDVTMKGMMKIFFNLIKESYDPYMNTIAIHFSGHGSYMLDTNGDELDNRDEVFVPVDSDVSGTIVDDWFQIILSKMNKDIRIVCTFDCCYSGTICDLKYSSDVNELGTCILNTNAKNNILADVILISGCKDDQYSYDAQGLETPGGFSGVMSTFFIRAVEEKLSSDGIGLIDVVTKTRELIGNRYPQTPMISSSRTFDDTTIIY